MTIAYLIELLHRKIANLSMLRTSAAALGEIDKVEQLDVQIAETETTLEALRSL
jgi:hypothetical protein